MCLCGTEDFPKATKWAAAVNASPGGQGFGIALMVR